MTGRRGRAAVGAAALATLLTGVVAGCSGTGSDAEPAASSASSRATEAWESATAEAGRIFGEIVQGLDVTDDISLGTPDIPEEGDATVEVTVRNTGDATRSFLAQVDWRDANGDLIDVTLVTVDALGAGHSAQATARSTHDLPSDARPEVARAVRY